MAEPENGSSPLAEALARVGDRWTLLVVEALLGGPQRFNDLLGQIPGIAANILSERLKRLEREGLLIARPYSERSPRAAYQLTAEGTELAGALRLLAHWGARHADPAEAPRHPACGTLLEDGERRARRVDVGSGEDPEVLLDDWPGGGGDHRGQVLLGRSPHVVPVPGEVRGRVDRRQGLRDAIGDVVHVLLAEHRAGAGAQPARVASGEVLPRAGHGRVRGGDGTRPR
jgi:DNA-binding HxlR family transcriptional regulator